MVILTTLAALTLAAFASSCFAAGNGAGAGGAGHQRAINSGLAVGEAGPPGSPNNRRRAVMPETVTKGAPHTDGAPAR